MTNAQYDIAVAWGGTGIAIFVALMIALLAKDIYLD